jgi:hypothetical protein
MDLCIDFKENWKTTRLGTPISIYSSLDQKTDPILFIGGVHGDEPEGVELAQQLIKKLYEIHKKISIWHPWVLIPCINPDGFKNNQRTNSQGVDLNRNFPCRDWSSESKASRYFPGTHPGSELETQAIISAIEEFKPQVIIHFHSWEPCIVYTGAPGKSWADEIALHCGYESKEDIGYPTPGSLGQYGWLEKQIPVICIEEKEHINLKLVWPRFEKSLLKILKVM